MTKLKMILPALLLLPLSMWGQLTAEQVFVDAPAQLFPAIKKITRMDMVDYFKSGSDRASGNRFGGLSRVLELTSDNLVMEEAQNNMVVKQIALDRLNSGDTAIIYITNIATPAMDGSVKVYTTGWSPVSGTPFQTPMLKDWIKKGVSKQDVKEVMSSVPFAMANYSYDPATHLLTLNATFQDYLPEDVMKKVGSLLYSSMTYKWNGRKFVLQQKL